MTKAEKIDKLRNMTQAYILYSNMTRLPYVECDEASYYDQVFIYELREDAEEAARKLCARGDISGVAQLNLVELEPPKEGNAESGDPQEPGRKLMRNQIREHLMRLPMMGLNAVYFQPAGEEGETLELDQVIPEEVRAELQKDSWDLSGVELTGIYFAQYLRREEKDTNRLREYSEEFHANLSRAELLLPAIPEEEHKDDPKLDLVKCKIPSCPIRRIDSGETFSFLAVFTNMNELTAYCHQVREKVRVVKVPFAELEGLINEPLIGCVVNPLSINIPIRKEDIPRFVELFKK